MTQPGEVERPPGGGPASPDPAAPRSASSDPAAPRSASSDPAAPRSASSDPAAPPKGVSVAWRSAAVREVAGPAADKLAADGLPASMAARDPGLWGPDAAAEVLDRAVAHGDEHVIKFTDTAAEVYARTGQPDALAAALRVAALIPSPRD